MKNALGREIPKTIGSRSVEAYAGAFAKKRSGLKTPQHQKSCVPGENKVLPSLDAALEATGLKSGMT
ncbi:MAG: citrate lyase subunit alpha, partial [Candidatus Bipolaricaulota bacterium]|nr:citrate lyase subunit alpha [Candidatus Bipolaricaulota bacterium]